MRPNGIGITALTLVALAAPGCSLEKHSPQTVLTNKDFNAETGARSAAAQTAPAHSQTDLSSPASSDPQIQVVPIGAVSGGSMLDIVARAETPAPDAKALPSGDPVLIDQKVGEINGRPIRVGDILDASGLGARLQAAAQKRRLSPAEWELVTGRSDPTSAGRILTRDEWLFFAGQEFVRKINGMLNDELLESEARASLKPAQKQGLQYLVQEAGENYRREAGGSRPAAERRLQESAAQSGVSSEQQYLRKQESTMLLEYQLDERVRKRVNVSWKDVRLYYERNYEKFNPPPVARFRIIRVPANKPDDVATIRGALDRGEPFSKVASMSENVYRPDAGGLLDDKPFAGDFAAAKFNMPPVLETAAHQLTPGSFTKEPVDFARDKAWICLDSIVRVNRPLSDQNVQIEIFRTLSIKGMEAEHQRYMEHLRERASFTGFGPMIQALMDAAAERYWPEGQDPTPAPPSPPPVPSDPSKS